MSGKVGAMNTVKSHFDHTGFSVLTANDRSPKVQARSQGRIQGGAPP